MKIKKLFSAIIAIMIAASLCACGNTEESSTPEKTSETTVATTSVTTTAPTPETTAPETTTTTTTAPQTTTTTTKVTTTTKNVTTTAKPKPVTTTKKVTTTKPVTTTVKPENKLEKFVGVYICDEYENPVYDEFNNVLLKSICFDVFMLDGCLYAQYFDIYTYKDEERCEVVGGMGSEVKLSKISDNIFKMVFDDELYFTLNINEDKLYVNEYHFDAETNSFYEDAQFHKYSKKPYTGNFESYRSNNS